MQLAKDRFDVGLMTGTEDMLTFMEDAVGLGAPEVLPVMQGVTQHRFDADGSVVKVNLVDGFEVPDERSGYHEVLLADPAVYAPERMHGPDGVVVSRVPTGHLDVTQLGMRVAVPDVEAAQQYFGAVLGWEVDGPIVRLGASALIIDHDPGAPTAVTMPVAGWSYLTVQVHDCDLETATAVSRGATLVRAPRTLGEVARFSMISDRWGNQLEISQRASLTGPLPADEDGT